MAYLVISCNACGTPRVAQAASKSTQCPRCGKRLPLDKVIVHARTGSAEEARDAVGQINAQKADGTLLREPELQEPPNRDAIDRAILDAREVTGQAMRVKLAAQGLTEEQGSFDQATWVEAMERLDINEPRALEHLERLIHANALAQPSPGSYQFVG